MNEMMYLILHIGYGTIVIPETYPSEQCLQIAKEQSSFNVNAFCVPAPKISIIKDESKLPDHTDHSICSGDCMNARPNK